MQPLGRQSAAEASHASDVGARFVEACDEAGPTGSAPPTNTTGIVVVAARMAGKAKLLPTITATPRRTRSVASAGKPAEIVVRKAKLHGDVLALDEPRLGKALAKRRYQMHRGRADVLRRIPITGIAGCCARAASGHAAAAPPISVMNSRRCMCPP